jgi:hypothetical protein
MQTTMILTLISTMMMDGEVMVGITRLHMINNSTAAPVDLISAIGKEFVELFCPTIHLQWPCVWGII